VTSRDVYIGSSTAFGRNLNGSVSLTASYQIIPPSSCLRRCSLEYWQGRTIKPKEITSQSQDSLLPPAQLARGNSFPEFRNILPVANADPEVTSSGKVQKTFLIPLL